MFNTFVKIGEKFKLIRIRKKIKAPNLDAHSLFLKSNIQKT